MRPLRERDHSSGKDGPMTLFCDSERGGAKRNEGEKLSHR
jgi:hypothetical protein